MVYVHLAEGFEEVEALTIVDVLRRAGQETVTVSVTGAKGVMGTHGIPVEADILYEEADYTNCKMIVLPGGMPGAANLEAHPGLTKHIQCFGEAIRKKETGEEADDKYLAAICAAPMAFGKHGVLTGRKATIYPGMEDCLKDGKATGQTVTVDGRIITGQGPALAMEFALTLVEILKGKEKAEEVAEGLLYSRA